MTVYPDTSFYVALRFFDDTHRYKELAADMFVSFDDDQVTLAKLVGLDSNRPV